MWLSQIEARKNIDHRPDLAHILDLVARMREAHLNVVEGMAEYNQRKAAELLFDTWDAVQVRGGGDILRGILTLIGYGADPLTLITQGAGKTPENGLQTAVDSLNVTVGSPT